MQWSLFVLVLMGQCCFFVCELYEYHFIEEKKTWEEARKYCRDHYTDLATVSNMTDMKRLNYSAQKGNGAWIGLYNETDANRMWHWSLPGVEYNETEHNWADSEPNDKKKPENCVRIDDDYEWEDAPCTTENKFICYDGLSVNSTEGNKSDQFFCSDKKMTWQEAQNYCREQHTDLISGRKQLDAIGQCKENDTEDRWIGLFRDTWRWSDGSNVSFRYWDLDLFKDEDNKTCAMTLLNGKWSSDKCNETKPFICYDDKVILIKEKKTWNDALDYCRKNHSDLVSITNPHQQRWVQERAKKANTSHVWMGLHYACFMDLWFWVNDCVVCYDNWAPGGRQQGCDRAAAMDKEGKWFKMSENDTFNFICTLK
ncbi:macrophage mannose receptor 1-like [Plectropomus leopardus]|uniref:macrophage mannose receptor 1-like n=1 Tax=Plectropomus leopardus TaxID=160734 RepID=UPI001C4B0BB0|nr:macrophage mannose receptor 1-like [Plectropomus leopardus]